MKTIYRYNSLFNKIDCYKLTRKEYNFLKDNNNCFKNRIDAVRFGYEYLLIKQTEIKHKLLDFKIENGLD